MSERDTSGYIAIIGMDGRFPGAKNLDEFWRNLVEGRDSTRELTDEELIAAGESRAKIMHPSYVRRCAHLDDIDKFDARFFGIAPRDAAVMDPQHRIFLEVAWGALENAGYDPVRVPGPVAVFAGSGMSYYEKFNVATHKKLVDEMGEWLVRHTANDRNFLSTLVSYKLNLTGPSMNVQTACSSALVAVHVACQSLLNRECDLAIAGGSTINFPQRGYVYEESEILSRDGRCRAFDSESTGTMFGSGAGAVVLRRLEDAIRAGDAIDAVICGSAINNDGSNKVGFLAPSVSGQTGAIVQALQVAQVDPATIRYVETHGTGTRVGDPIEVVALRQAFAELGYRVSADENPTCGLGSVKSNIGHLGEAAGVAGLIKLCLSLRHETLPASLHFVRPNPELGIERSPFYIVAERGEFRRGSTPRRAAVTALGAGGTNAHVVLEEAPEPPAPTEDALEELLLLSAKSPAALQAMSLRLAEHLESHPEIQVKDLAYTLREGRQPFAYRRAIFVDVQPTDAAREAARLLRDVAGVAATKPAFDSPPRLTFLFPGGGAQYGNMGRELYETEDVYRAAIDECAEYALAAQQIDIRTIMYCEPGGEEQASRALESPRLSLPTLFATSYALAKLLLSFGFEPDAMLGHSMGEYVAACLADVFSVRDAMALVIERGRLFEQVEEGGMLALPLSPEEAQPLLGPELSFAAINAPKLCVASGRVSDIDRLQAELERREMECTRVHIRVAAHSALLDPILPAFRSFCQKIEFRPATRRYVSNLTGDWVRPEDAATPEYWVKHLRSTVQFSKGLETILEGGNTILLEVGPGRTLVSVARQHARDGKAPTALSTLRHVKETVSDRAFLFDAIGKMWAAGGRVDFNECLLPADSPRRVHLPTYPFEHESYFLHRQKTQEDAATDLLKRADVGQWFCLPTFTSAPIFVSDSRRSEPRQWLVFVDQVGAHGRLRPHLSGRVTSVRCGLAFSRMDADVFEVNPARAEDFEALLDSLDFDPKAPVEVLYFWPTTLRRSKIAKKSFDELANVSFQGVLSLLQAAGDQRFSLRLSVVTNGALSVNGERVEPEKALALGPVRVARREVPSVSPRLIDWQYDPIWDRFDDAPISALRDELMSGSSDPVVALRSGGRFVESLSQITLPEAPPNDWFTLRSKYLVTGAFGGIGRELSLAIAALGECTLVLVGRKALPPRARWSSSEMASDVAERVVLVQQLEALGATVHVEVLDLGDESAVAAMVAKHGDIRGAFHAAGVLDDGPIEAKTQDAAWRVIAAKAKSACALATHLPLETLDFLVLFSSSSSRLGLRGQVDYTAANAVLDALAADLQAQGFKRVVSINWGTWKDVGMAARMARDASAKDAGEAHPIEQSSLDLEVGPRSERERTSWWGRVVPLTDGLEDARLSSVFSSVDDWLLREHRLTGGPTVMPGTGYVDLTLSALAKVFPGRRFELLDLVFLEPFSTVVGSSRELTLVLSGNAVQGEVQFVSPREIGRGETTHVTLGYVELREPPVQRESLTSLRTRTPERVVVERGFLAQDFVAFGPRWGNLVSLEHGEREAVLEIALPAFAHRDLQYSPAHPAMLDIATGGAQVLIDDFDQTTEFFVPFSYGTIRAHAAFPPRITSIVRFRGRQGQTATFDVTIVDEAGQTVMEIESFVMKKVAVSEFGANGSGREAESMRTTQANAEFLALVAQGTTIQEGMDVIARVLHFRPGPSVFATPVDMNAWLDETDRAERGLRGGGEIATFELSSERPRELPATDLESELVELWSEVLGVKGLGVLDDFFDLGGHSLIAARVFVRIRKKYGVSLPLSALFAAPTIRALAHEIDPNGSYIGSDLGARSQNELAAESRPAHGPAVPVWSPIVPIQPKGSLPPFFCAPGMGGNPLGQRFLSERLGKDQPFYGLQARGVDGAQEPHTSVEEMAQEYLTAILHVQPRGPYHLGGFSGGGVVAFEIAKQLLARGETIGLLALLDAYNPLLPLSPRSYRARAKIARVRQFGMPHLSEVLRWKIVVPLERSGAMDFLKGTARTGGQQSFESERAALDHKMMSSWVAAERRYRPTSYSGDAVLFRSQWDILHGRMDVLPDAKNGWGQLILGSLEVIDVPGTHDSFLLEPNVRHVAESLSRFMRRAVRERRVELGRSPSEWRETASGLRGLREDSGIPSVKLPKSG